MESVVEFLGLSGRRRRRLTCCALVVLGRIGGEKRDRGEQMMRAEWCKQSTGTNRAEASQ